MKNYKTITKEESIDSLKNLLSTLKENNKSFEKTKYYIKRYEQSKDKKTKKN